MRYLGLDLGSKTLGISISDTTNTIASVYTTLRFSEDNNLDTLDELKKGNDYGEREFNGVYRIITEV